MKLHTNTLAQLSLKAQKRKIYLSVSQIDLLLYLHDHDNPDLNELRREFSTDPFIELSISRLRRQELCHDNNHTLTDKGNDLVDFLS